MRVVNQKQYVQTAPSAPVSPYSSSQQAPSEGNQLSDTAKLMNELKNTYKNIQFDFVSFTDTNQIKEYAASKNGFHHVAISPELLEKMVNNEDLKNHVKNVLSQMNNYRFSSQVQAELMDKELTGMGLVLNENGDVSKWTAMKEKKEQDFSWLYPKKDEEKDSLYSQNKVKKESPFAVSYKYSHSQSMMKLANAKNVASVRGLIAQKQGEIQKVKWQVKDPVEAAMIIRRIKKLIQSGNIKIARLHKEERIWQQKRAAARKMKFKQEQRLAEELRRKRVARKAQEHCQTASFDDIFVKPSLNDYRYKQIVGAYEDTMSGYAGFVPGSATVSGISGSSGGASAASVEITVTPIVSVDCSA